MSSRVSVALALSLAAASCGDDAPSEVSPSAPADAAAPPAPADAGVASPTGDRDDDEADLDDWSGDFHIDEPSLRGSAGVAPPAAARRLEITLRSTPTGARVLVDGEPIGETPAYWSTEASGRPHEFTFVRPGYEMARYRFVPTRSGILHATLDRLAGPVPHDAGPAPARDD